MQSAGPRRRAAGDPAAGHLAGRLLADRHSGATRVSRRSNARWRSPCKEAASPGPTLRPRSSRTEPCSTSSSSINDGHADFRLGFIRLEWTLFEGGRRIAATRVADSQVRQAMAQAESIADQIAFQVNEAYRSAVTAWVGIDDARPAVDQAQRELPARATATPRGSGHADRDRRRAGLADPRRTEST